MEVTVAKSAGFCFGVKRAVDTVYREIESGEKPVYTFGPIIHNEQVVEDLENRGVQVLAENSIGASEGDTVSVTASTKSVLFSSFILYILPVILFIVSLILGGAVFKSEKLSLIFTAVSLAVWLIVIKFLGKKEITHTISEVIYHRD